MAENKPSIDLPSSVVSSKEWVPPSIAKLRALKNTRVVSALSPSPAVIAAHEEEKKAAHVKEIKEYYAAKKAGLTDETLSNYIKRISEEKKNKFMTLIQNCHTPEDDLIKLLVTIDNPLDTIDDVTSNKTSSGANKPSTPLSYAIRCNKLNLAEKIIDKIHAITRLISDIDIIQKALVSLLEAVENRNIAAVKLLINKIFSKIDLRSVYSNKRYIRTIFSKAIATNDLELISILVSDKSLPYYEDIDMLHDAIQKDNIGAAEVIINKGGIDINEISNSNTSLTLAVTNNNIPMVLMLLNKGASITLPDGYPQPIEIALDNKNIEMMRLLLDRGASITSKMRNSLSKLPGSINNSRNIITFLQPYLAAQERIPVAHTRIVAFNKTTPRPVATFGIQEEDGMPILTIPQGSLLYNSFYVKVLKDPHTGKIDLNAVIKTLGGLMPLSTSVTETTTGLKITGCVDKFSQKFFYTNPVGGAALMNVVGDDLFNVTGTFQAKRDMRLALLMSPGPFHRLEDMNSKPHPALRVCSETPADDCECAKTPYRNSYKCKFGFEYDVCIAPEFLHAHNLDGHIAIAGADSYERRFNRFQKIFNGLSVEERYKALSDLIFNRCMSIDNRSTNTFSGFPELVIQIFGTDWYSAHRSQRFEYEIPLATATATDEDKVRAIVNFLLDFNSQMGPVEGIPVQTPLQLIRTATEYHWYNFETGDTRDNAPIADLTSINTYYRYFLASLQAYFNDDLRFIIDPRTGFLVRPGHLPPVLLSDGTPMSYEAMCFGTAEGSSELAISARARFTKTSAWHTAFGTNADKNMLELKESYDISRNTNKVGGTRYRGRRKSVKKHKARPRSHSKSHTRKSFTRTSQTRTSHMRTANRSARHSTRRSTKRSTKRSTRRSTKRSTKLSTKRSIKHSMRRENIALDKIYSIYMDEIKKRLRTK